MASTSYGVTQLLAEWSRGDQAALNKLLPLVHEELRRLAHHYMRGENPGHPLQTGITGAPAPNMGKGPAAMGTGNNYDPHVFYLTVDEAWRPDTVWRHRLGSTDPDVKVFYEADDRYWVGIGSTGLMIWGTPFQHAARRALERWLPATWVRPALGFVQETLLLTVAAQIATLPSR